MPTKHPASFNLIESLYSEHHGWLFGWLRRRLGSNCDAADLTQDTYLRLMLSGRLPPDGQSRAYLMQVAKGLVIDLHRRRRLEFAYQEALAELPAACTPSLEQQALIMETLQRIDQVLDGLSHKAREAFLLSQFEGLTYSQIAGRLNVSVGSVRKYMLKAMQACLPLLEG